MQFRDVEPHRIGLAFLDERWFQSSATHVATLRRMADRAVADPALLTIVAVESGGALPACCAGCARFVDEGAFTVTLMSLLRRERLYRSALGWFGGRPTCAWSRAAPRPSCRSTRRFSLSTVLDGDHLCDTTKRPQSRRCWATRDVEQECDVCRCAGSSSSLRNGSGVRRRLTRAQAPRRQRQEGRESNRTTKDPTMLSRAVRRIALLSGQTPSMMGRMVAVVAPASVAPRAPRVAFGSVAASDARVDAEHRHQQIQAAINKAARQLEDAHAEVARLEAAKGSADEIQRSLASVDSARMVSRSTIKQHITAGHAALVDLVMNACVETNTPFKSDPETWGVTRDDDPRMTPHRFGDYKSPQRLATEAKLREYMSAPSRSRETGLRDFSIAVTVAAPGTGKTRLLDDALRMPLDTTHFAHVLRLAIAFNGLTGGVFAHPVAARMLCEFFCGPAAVHAEDVLKKIDAQLSRLFPSDNVNTVAQRVLDALEALYFQQRGDGTLGRSVLLIDEISKAFVLVPGDEEKCEKGVYRTVVSWVDAAKGRRGAVFTGLTIMSPWAEASSAGRPLVRLPLGTFDVWDAAVQRAIEHEARRIWPGFGAIHHRLWPLLAATGGRPRDVLLVLERLKEWRVDLTNAEDEALLSALRVDDADSTFSRYLLPSMLGVQFDTFDSGRSTQFGNDAASSALLNADLLATKLRDVPVVSLRFSRSFAASADHLRHVFAALVKATVFCKLDGSGKDFERAWVLLTYTILQLQFLVRVSAATRSFWPTLDEPGVKLGGPARPTAEQIDVFAVNASTRIEALFARPDDDRVFEAPGSSIRRKMRLRKPPTLALWKNAWTATVEPGAAEDVPSGWPMTLDVEWRPWTVVYFSDAANAAIDFMLLVGKAGGTGDSEPHVYVFQSKAPSAENVAQAKVAEIAHKLQEKLNVLFGESHASTHVLRLAGIQSARQVTLCIAALNCGKVDLKVLGAPFNVVLFDSADFRGLGGAAFRDTCFFRSMAAAKK
jgi:hypothetical protein